MGSRFGGLRERMAAAGAEPPRPEDEDEDEISTTTNTEEEDDMSDQNTKPEAAAPTASDITASVIATAPDLHGRTKAVFADEKVKGKEGYAASLLTDAEFDGLSAAGIVKLVGAYSATAPNAAADDGAAMLAAMREANGADLGAEGGSSETELAAVNHGWDDIHAEVEATRKAIG